MIIKNTKTIIKEKDLNDPNAVSLKPREETISVLRPYINFLNSMIDIYDTDQI